MKHFFFQEKYTHKGKYKGTGGDSIVQSSQKIYSLRFLYFIYFFLTADKMSSLNLIHLYPLLLVPIVKSKVVRNVTSQPNKSSSFIIPALL